MNTHTHALWLSAAGEWRLFWCVLISALTADASWSSAFSSASQCSGNSSSRTTCLRSASREYNEHTLLYGHAEQFALPWFGLYVLYCSKLKKLIRYIKSKRRSFQEEEYEKKLQRYETDHFLEPFAGLTPEYMEMSECLTRSQDKLVIAALFSCVYHRNRMVLFFSQFPLRANTGQAKTRKLAREL